RTSPGSGSVTRSRTGPSRSGSWQPVVGDHGTARDIIGHHRMVSHSVSAAAGGADERPDPTTVQTVEDLAYHLSLLRLSTPGRRPGNPLTMRELEQLSGVPHSTIGNAES